MKTKICAISDLHGQLPEIEECDLLLIAGDICPVSSHTLPYQLGFLNGPFRNYLENLPAKEIVLVPGNHDFIFQLEPNIIPDLRCNLLIDDCVNLFGMKIYGTPWQTWYGSWAYNAPKDDPSEEFLGRKALFIPDDTDIIVSHGPAYGFGDYAPIRDKDRKIIDWEHTGSRKMLERIIDIKPKLFVCGHVHEGYGQWEISYPDGGEGIIANCSLRDGEYRCVNNPLYFERRDTEIVSIYWYES